MAGGVRVLFLLRINKAQFASTQSFWFDYKFTFTRRSQQVVCLVGWLVGLFMDGHQGGSAITARF